MKCGFLFTLLISCPAFSQQENVIDSRLPLRIDYTAPTWNKDSNKPESMKVILRDSRTSRMAQIQVNEMGNNSSVFKGTYLVSWNDTTEITPEFYVVPQSMTASADSLKKIDELIKGGTLLRKPMFARKTGRNETVISIFDNREQANQAFNEWQTNLPKGKKIVDPAALEAQANAERLSEQMKLAAMANAQEMERDRQEEIERKKREELLKQQAAMDEAERARRQAQAKELAKQALAAYNAGEFQKAEGLFAKVVELDPNNQGIYYQFGITLYRNDKFDKSLVVLENANDPSVDKTEKFFFMGLNYMKLKEFDGARKSFESIKSSSNKILSASAAFYVAIIDFQKENYESAKTNFEFTLDNSSDPKLDEQAESYIEQIANIMAFKAEQEKKFLFTFSLGATQDSNVLSASNSQLDSQATNAGGMRYSYGGSATYRPVYGITHEFATILSYNDMYSPDTQFQNADPIVTSFSAPYRYKGLAFGKGYQLGLIPSYESINLNADGSGAREVISNSTVFKVDQTFVMNGDWFSNYTLEFRDDKSKIDSAATPQTDATATKITIMTTNTVFTDKKKNTAYIIEAGGAQNTAKGDDQKYTKLDLAATYLMPAFWETSFTSRLGLYQQTFPSHTTGRSDLNTGLTLGFSKPLSKSWGLSVNANYTINKSTADANDYKKYTIGTALGWNGSL